MLSILDKWRQTAAGQAGQARRSRRNASSVLQSKRAPTCVVRLDEHTQTAEPGSPIGEERRSDRGIPHDGWLALTGAYRNRSRRAVTRNSTDVDRTQPVSPCYES